MTPLRARQVELLTAAANALQDGQDPLATPFLTAHAVTLQESFDLADNLTAGALIFADAIRHPAVATAVLSRGRLEPEHLQTILRILSHATREDV